MTIQANGYIICEVFTTGYTLWSWIYFNSFGPGNVGEGQRNVRYASNCNQDKYYNCIGCPF
ncbi:hypothetical protein [Mucilaginibacter sp. NFR10]|uniref:hypothetical protein n=1 Tax=Mucilaginibacter sp. NFR10 TaxID=1566292 RepID=UPI001C318DB0|nr:hypothetical protein [Mucilaginibacter sp. NFR10]